MAILIKEIVPSLLAKRSDWQTKLLSQWDSILGSLKTRVRLEKIQDDTLVIGVYEVHWMQELHLLSQVLIDSINQFLGEPRIRQLRFKLVEETKHKRRNAPSRKVLTRIDNIVLTNAQKQALNDIQDGQLKDALIHFWARCLER